MNHRFIYDHEPPAFCFQPGYTTNADALIDCPICQERIERRSTEDKQEHYDAAMQLVAQEVQEGCDA